MEPLRAKADEWNLYADRIAVVGFSAGGHLAASAATIAKNKPNAAVPAPLLAAAQEKLAAQYGDTAFGSGSSTLGEMGLKMTLRAAPAYANTPAEQVEQLDAALRQIPNTET